MKLATNTIVQRLSGVGLALATSVQVAKAQSAPNIPNPTGSTSFGQILFTVINGLLIFAGAIAVLFLIVGGFRYVVSTGNPDSVEGAKKTILYAILGLVVIMIAFLIVNVVLRDVLKVNTQYVPK